MAAAEGSILPLEMLLKIFSYLDIQEIEKSVAPVCRLWHDASRLPVVRRRLTLTSEIPPSAAHAMLRRSPLLKELTIGCRFTDDLLRTAAAHNLKLRVLTIWCDVSDIGLEAIAQCSQLRTLSLNNTRDVTDGGVAHLARLSHLETLRVVFASRVTPAGWRRLLSMWEWPHLRQLELCLIEKVPQVHFERLPTTLRSIGLFGPVSDIDLEAVAQCDQLRTLSLCSTPRITDDGVVDLARLRHLEKLQISGANSVTAAGWRQLFSKCEWPHLRELTLRLSDEDEEPQVHFERLPTTLRTIKLYGSVSDVDLEAVAQCHKLRTLSLYSTPRITDDGVVHLARLRHLEKLELRDAKSVTAAVWRRLFSVCEWPHLRDLDLCLSDEDEEPQVHFERLPTTLRTIKLYGSVSDVDLEAVAQCHKLRTLSLYSTPRITDNGVVHLARLRHLEKLQISGANSVTAAGWRRLLSTCEWPHLRQLNLMDLHGLCEGEREDLRRQAELLCPNVTIR